MINYAPRLPKDKTDATMQQYPSPKLALARYAPDNSSASSVISVTHDTTALEIAAITTSAALKWIATSDTAASVVTIAGGTANFDHIIPVGTVRRFVIPIESNPQVTSVQGVNIEYGLYRRFAIISTGTGSVLSVEF